MYHCLQGKKVIKEIANNITDVEIKCNVNQEDTLETIEKLNFGLMEVVYEWARGKVSENLISLQHIFVMSRAQILIT